MEITGLPTPVFCGVDWAEDHHDIALVDAGGQQLVKVRISDDAAGFAQLMALLAEHGDNEDTPIPVAIETSRGLLVACLRSTGRPVFAINPLAVARYRDRHSVARKKSDAVDAAALANILRTDMAAHRPLPADSELVQAIAVLARAQQDAVWARGQAHNKLRSQLREFYPAILDAFAQHKQGLCSREARSILAAAPTPAMAAKLTRRRLQSLLKQAGRVRGIQAEAERLHEVFGRDYLHQLPQVEAALGHQTSALLRQLNTACDNADQLEEAVTQAFEEHPDAPVIRSFPGLAALTGARVLAEIGDDRTRFATAGSLKAYAGSAPITSLRRAAIEPHEQDFSSSGIDLIIDAARDCLDHLVDSDPAYAAAVISAWSGSDIPMLQRLGIHGWERRADVSADDKIRWVLAHGLLYASGPKHEVFRLIARALPEARASRGELLEAVLVGPTGEGAEKLEERSRVYKIYKLLVWITTSEPDFAEARQALDKQQEAYPDFKPPTNPDLIITSHGGFSGQQSPVTREQLERRTSPEDIAWMLTYRGELAPDSLIDRYDLLVTITDTAAANPAWGLTVASALAAADVWDTDLWPTLTEGWTQAARQQMSPEFPGILDLLARQPASSTGFHQTTQLLVVMAEAEGLSMTLLDACEHVATALWDTAGSAPDGTVADLDLTGGSVWEAAINHWSGELATFWVQAASRRWKTEPDTWSGLPDPTAQALGAMLDETSRFQLAAVAVLARSFAFLLAADEAWTTSVLLPSFAWTDPTRASAAWDGYLSAGRWNERVLTLLKPSLTEAFTKLEGRSRAAWVGFMAGLQMHRAASAANDASFLSAFLAAASAEERQKWAETIAQLLNRIEDPSEAEAQWDLWITTYWNQRLDNLPRPLSYEETGQMLPWIIYAGASVPAAVDLLEKSPARFTNVFSFFRRLKGHPVLTAHPMAAARLVAHVLENCEGPVLVCSEIGAVIRVLIDHGDQALAPHLHRACEGAARVGCPEAMSWDDELKQRGW